VSDKNIPLCIDCDGTLIKTDLLYEAVFLLIKQNFLKVFLLPFWLLKGKAFLKARLAENVTFNYSLLPYREEIIHKITEAKRDNRKIVLATASPQVWASEIQNHLQLFDEVLATNNIINLSGINKANMLVKYYGEYKFDYIGDSREDKFVFDKARNGILVSNSVNLVNYVNNPKLEVIGKYNTKFTDYIEAIRVYQWLKNLLIFVPILAAHQLYNKELVINGILAFLAFSFSASAIYVLNDLLDLENDRDHIRKRNRPFAAVKIPIKAGFLLIPFLLIVSLVNSVNLNPSFILVIFGYLFLTSLYSTWLKKQVIVDVMLLTCLYTTRLVAGAAATGISLSFWLIEFSLFFFLSLALVKRYSELLIVLTDNKTKAMGRGYRTEDIPVLRSLGAAAGLGSVLIFSLYINAPETLNLYRNALWLWGVVPFILYWNTRLWMKTCRHEVEDDPILFAVKDWQTITAGACVLILFLLAYFL
jgi:4-hydroxybenzoate polyprenyltransferase/phosphoserine phosphatase